MAQTDSIGDRMKTYEAVSTQRRAFKGQPIVARLDGSKFHNFTKGLKRPYDERLTKLMVHCMRSLVEQYGATVGYTQSDEITLVWFVESSSKAEYNFGGRFQKYDSHLAATCSTVFNRDLQSFIPEKGGTTPIFDCRTFVVPNLLEAYHTVLWRQQDCTKNAISMAAQSMFSHKSLQGLSGPEMQEKMWAESGVNFNEFPAFFRRGTFVRRMKTTKPLDADVLKHLAGLGKVPPGPVERTELQVSHGWLSRMEDPVSYLFKGGPEAYLTATGELMSIEAAELLTKDGALPEAS